MNNFGLSKKDLQYILLAVKHFDEIEKCVIFGSRAIGNYKSSSDIDIALFGEKLNSLQIVRFRSLLNECFPIIFYTDIVHFDKLKNQELQEHIQNFGKIIYQRPPLVSVLMTVYNREKYIAEAIESVLKSSYTNFELIIVDDRSTDKSVKIAKSYEEKDNRIKVYINEENLGQFENRNHAASYAKGKYIKYLDSDDLIYPHGLEVMVKAMEQFPKAAYALSFRKVHENQPYPIFMNPDESYLQHFFTNGLFNEGPTSLIFRTNIFEKEKGFQSFTVFGDAEILLRLSAKYPMVKMQPALTWWRQHEGQEFDLGNKNNVYFDSVFKLNLKYLKNKNSPLSEPDKAKAINRLKQHHARKILALFLKQRKTKQAYLAFHQSQLSFFELLKGFKAY